MQNIKKTIIKSSILKGAGATIAMLVVYFMIVTLVSGWVFALDQFSKFWYFIILLALGFGIQVSIHAYLKGAIKSNASPRMLAVSGTTSTAAMISCCAHYLVNLLPILGTVGIITIISQYQIQFFWIGLLFNFVGISYMLNRVMHYTRKI